MNINTLTQAAKKASLKAYSPYSKAKVGAALLLENGKVITGCNVENASFGATICAERTAVTKAVSEFGKIKIKAIAVHSPGNPPWAPCGVCLQVMSEFAKPGTPIFLSGPKTKTQGKFSQFLPLAFKDEKLKKN